MGRKAALSLGGAAALALLAGLAWLSPRVIPFNMDELVHYQALGCATAPLQRGLPVFRDGCFLYDLRLPLTDKPLPLRSYFYIGSFPSLPFYPFWRLLDDPVAVRLQGAVFFAIWFWLARGLARVGAASLAIASLALPAFLTAFVVDLGPVGLAAVLFAAALLALRRALARGRAWAANGWAAFAGVLLFLGLWSKLVFACLLPAILVYALSDPPARVTPLSARLRALGVALLAFAVPTAILLASVDGEGHAYAAAVVRGRVSLEAGPWLVRLGQLLRAAFDPREHASRNIEIGRTALDLLPALLTAAIVCGAAWRARTRRLELAAWSALAGVTLAGLSLSEFCRWPHHAFYGLLLLVPALAIGLDGLGRRARWAAALAVVACWSSLALRWSEARYPGESSPEKDALLRLVRVQRLDRETLQVHASWGTYYIAQLFGDPARTVVYLKAFSDDPRLIEQTRELARERGRRLLLISSRRYDRLLTPAIADRLGRPAQVWRFGDWWALDFDVARDREGALSPSSPRP